MNKAIANILLAKPSGITLEQHIKDVVSESMAICQVLPTTLSKYSKIVGEDLFALLQGAAEWHDEGKKSEKWQNACIKDFQRYQLWKEKNHGGNFIEYRKNNWGEAGQYLQKVGFRHEMKSLCLAPKGELSIVQQISIAAHHSKLGYNFESKWNILEFQDFWYEFIRFSNQVM